MVLSTAMKDALQCCHNDEVRVRMDLCPEATVVTDALSRVCMIGLRIPHHQVTCFHADVTIECSVKEVWERHATAPSDHNTARKWLADTTTQGVRLLLCQCIVVRQT